MKIKIVMAALDDLNLTSSQTKAIEELRKRMSGELEAGFKQFDESCLLYRFLKARDFDVSKAEIMLRKSLQWRRQNDPIIKDYKPPEVLKKYLAHLYIGSDKEGCPIFYIPCGNYDIKGMHIASKCIDIERTVLQFFEEHENRIEQESKKFKKRWTRFVIIFNSSGQTLANTLHKDGIETLIRLGKVQQDNFPERLKAVFIINAPSYFTFLYSIVKKILSAETIRKIQIYGKEGWQEEIFKVIDADQLPVFMGGTRTDPDGDPLCKTFLNQGGKIDESYYVHKDINPLSNAPDAQKVRLARSSSKKLTLDIREVGSDLEWQFETRSGDVGFGLYFKETGDEEEEMREIIPIERFNTKIFVESGMYKCEKPGHYVVVFDNSYSWLRSKELIYRIKVLKPNELEDQINE